MDPDPTKIPGFGKISSGQPLIDKMASNGSLASDFSYGSVSTSTREKGSGFRECSDKDQKKYETKL